MQSRPEGQKSFTDALSSHLDNFSDVQAFKLDTTYNYHTRWDQLRESHGI